MIERESLINLGSSFPRRRLHALYLPSRQGNPKVRAFIDWLVTELANAGPD